MSVVIAPDRMPDAEIRELLADALACPRLSAWEQAFVAGMIPRREPVVSSGAPKFDLWVSDKQHAVLLRIRSKVYAT